MKAKRLVAVLTAVSLMAGLCGMAEPNADQKIKLEQNSTSTPALGGKSHREIFSAGLPE